MLSISRLPKIVHLRSDKNSLVFDCASGRIPRLVYWGKALTGEDAVTLENLTIASRESLDGNCLDSYSQTGIVPLESDGWPGRAGLKGFRNQGSDWSPIFELIDIEWGGADPNFLSDCIAEATGANVAFVLSDDQGGLGMRVVTESLPEGIFRLHVEISNDAKDGYHLEELGIALPVPLQAKEILSMTGRWGKERVPQRQKVAVGAIVRENHHGRTGFDAPDMTFVGVDNFGFDSGDIWGLHVAFSGNHRSWVEKTLTGQQVIGGSELLYPGEIELMQGQSYRTPWFYVIASNGLDEAANRVHRWLRGREQHVRHPRPVTLNVWEAVYFDHEEKKLFSLADVAADIGVERFVLDDGWFAGRRDATAGLGDWWVDREVWPDGLEPLVRKVRSLGMQFGLWFEPEMINLDSDLARTHPEWVMSARTGRGNESLPLSWRGQQVLNIAIPEARDYIKQRIVELVHEVGIDYIKWDHNRDIIDGGDQTRQGCASVHAQTTALYRLLDEIRAECPDLEVETCASGGGRIDLEILQHTDRVWVSDCIDPVERQGMVRWLSQIVPFEYMGTHIASPWSKTTGRWSSLSYRATTALWGSLGIEWDISTANPEELDQLSAWIDFYKQYRGLLHSGSLVRCEGPDPTISVIGVVDASMSHAMFQVSTHGRSEVSPRGRLIFPGLKDEARYRIKPVLIGAAPSGLVAPPWFGAPGDQCDRTMMRTFDLTDSVEGTVLSGQALRVSGIQMPHMHPEQALLLNLTQES